MAIVDQCAPIGISVVQLQWNACQDLAVLSIRQVDGRLSLPTSRWVVLCPAVDIYTANKEIEHITINSAPSGHGVARVVHAVFLERGRECRDFSFHSEMLSDPRPLFSSFKSLVLRPVMGSSTCLECVTQYLICIPHMHRSM